MFQFIKFAIVGVLNTAVDFAVLNILLFTFGVGDRRQLYAVFKGISFLAAVINSYLFNKLWVFQHAAPTSVREQALFVLVSGFGFLANVGIAHVAFELFIAWGGLSVAVSANLAALLASAAVFVSNYLGYKFIVFIHNEEVPSDAV